MAHPLLVEYTAACAIITYREVRWPTEEYPLPIPAPKPYTGAGLVYVFLGLVAHFLGDRGNQVSQVFGLGLLIGLFIQTMNVRTAHGNKSANPMIGQADKSKKKPGKEAQAPGSGKTQTSGPFKGKVIIAN